MDNDRSGNFIEGYKNVGVEFQQPSRSLAGIEATLTLQGTTGLNFEADEALSVKFGKITKELYVRAEEQKASGSEGWITKVVANEAMAKLLQVAVRKNVVFMSLSWDEYSRFNLRVNQYGGYSSLPYIPYIYISSDEIHDDGWTVYGIIETICSLLGYSLTFGIYSHCVEQVVIPANEPLFSVLFRLVSAYNPLIFFENNNLILADRSSFSGLGGTAEVNSGMLVSRQRLYHQVTDRVHVLGSPKGRYTAARDRYNPDVSYRSDNIPIAFPVCPDYELDKKPWLRRLQLQRFNIGVAWEGRGGNAGDYSLYATGTDEAGNQPPADSVDKYRYTQQIRQANDIYGEPWFSYLFCNQTEKQIGSPAGPDGITPYMEIDKIKEVRVMAYTSRDWVSPLVYRWYRNRSGYIWYLKDDGTTGSLYMNMDELPPDIYGPLYITDYLKGPVEVEGYWMYLNEDKTISRIVRQRFAWTLLPIAETDNPLGTLYELERTKQHSEINLPAGEIGFRWVANEEIKFRRLTHKSYEVHTERWYFDRFGKYHNDSFINIVLAELPKYVSPRRTMQLESSINEFGTMFINEPADMVEDPNLVRLDDIDMIAWLRYYNQVRGDVIYRYIVPKEVYLERGWGINLKSYQSFDNAEEISKPNIVSGAWIESIKAGRNNDNKGYVDFLVEAQLN